MGDVDLDKQKNNLFFLQVAFLYLKHLRYDS